MVFQQVNLTIAYAGCRKAAITELDSAIGRWQIILSDTIN
ncbi:hypothetical protein BN137_1594 [Cronobacter condimenti 1330]|uniref:Uncharacterized protein n=1 Tax=Cronobacter condimenti 1330 TaxID=1073999 RepID=K8A902_9ENTR|nr:hypothetical protein BN137_1594 [Cronobacter condimenti 1330]